MDGGALDGASDGSSPATDGTLDSGTDAALWSDSAMDSVVALDVATDLGPSEGPAPLEPYSAGTCPTMTDGDVTFTAGGKTRTARIFLPAEPEGAGVLYMWHGLGDSVSNFSTAMQAQTIATTRGWIVVVPQMEPAAGFMPALWGFPSLLGGVPDADLALFDDLAACIDATWQIDRARIYTLGFSAGALWSTYLTLYRSEVLAASVVLSGGVSASGTESPTTFEYESPLRQLPVFMAHGGATDIYDAVVVTLEFHAMTENLADALVADGHFGVICRHGTGHYFTAGVATSSLQFLGAHSWENTTSFWQTNGLPGSFDASCSIHE